MQLSCVAEHLSRLANHLRGPVETDRLDLISVDQLTKQPARPATDVEDLSPGQVTLSHERRRERTEVAAAKVSIRRRQRREVPPRIAASRDDPIVSSAAHAGAPILTRVSRDAAKAILWDFDGTLARRAGGTSFGTCMVETLDEHEPDHGIDLALIQPFLRSGFPWHAPDIVHPHLSTAASWWEHVEPLLVRGFEGVGFASARARTLGRLARERYVDVRHWEVFDETISALSTLRELGWRHVILSNHVPELPAIVRDLGLAPFFDASINSAETGYEKPHPQAFAIARRAAGNPSTLWMVGDNPVADVAGAQAVGIPAILVRVEPGPDRPVNHYASTLSEVVQIVAHGRPSAEPHERFRGGDDEVALR